MHRSAEVYALPGLQHEDSGDKVGLVTICVVLSQQNLIQKHMGISKVAGSNCNICGSLMGEMIWSNIQFLLNLNSSAPCSAVLLGLLHKSF